MKNTYHLPLVLLAIVFYIFCAACTSAPAVSPGPAATSPALMQAGTPGQNSVPDLTDQNSPQAAGFDGKQSITPLVSPQPVIGFSKIAKGFVAPMMMAVPPDGTGRIFVADQTGIVKRIDNDPSGTGTPFLDLRDRMVPLSNTYDERGLFSIAFHPEFANNSRVFVYYSAPLRANGPAGWSCTNRLSEFRVIPGNPDKVDPLSEKILFEVDKPYQNHNGGQILFGPDDGYLYLPLGDGGRADDTGMGHTPVTGNAQDPSTLLGKFIRIDVDSPAAPGKMYAIPPENPFVNTPGFLPEIYAMGFRNPAYASFDAADGHHLTTGVAGQKYFEPVFIVVKGGNYGWNIREGTHCFNPADDSVVPSTCATTGARGEPLIGPIVELGHDIGSVVVGGYIYRGTALPDLAGKYIFGDWSGLGSTTGSGTILVATPPAGYGIGMYPFDVNKITPKDNQMWTTQQFRIAGAGNGQVNAFVRGFGEDDKHELYVLVNSEIGPDPLQTTGEVWKIVPAS